MARYRYSRWDGTQAGDDLDADEVLARVTDDLLYHGDLNAALRRLLHQGFSGRDGERVLGIRELLERIRQRRREELERRDPGGIHAEVNRELEEVVEAERAALDELERQARQSGDARRREVTEQAAAERRLHLDLLPPDLAGRVRGLQDHDFTSSEARERFEQLLERLRAQLLESTLGQLAASMREMTDDDVRRMRDMLDALNRMVEQRERGEDTDAAFAEFMEHFGDMVPGAPQNLEELLELIAGRMAAMQALLDAMTPEQRAELRSLADALLDDLDLRWQADRLAANLRRTVPGAGWGQRYPFSGADPLGLGEADRLLADLADLDGLEQLLRSATSAGALADADVERARDLLGDDVARSLERLAELARLLEEAGLVDNREGRLELTPRGLRRIGNNALADLFARITADRLGRHEVEQAGPGQARSFETKPYEFGDPFHLHIERTVGNAVRRGGASIPVRLEPEDFEVERTETMTRTATVLMLDLSLSMPMRDNFLAAKKVAMALQSLIQTRYPRDFLGLVGFSKIARELRPEQLPEVSWDFDYGTNMQHGFQIARRLLARQPGTRQIVMITDGEPTAHVLADGDVFFHYPPVPDTVDATLAEVVRCTREGIRINTFMLDATPTLRDFVDTLTRLNRGRAFFTTPDTLGEYVLVDFVEQRTSRRSGRGAS